MTFTDGFSPHIRKCFQVLEHIKVFFFTPTNKGAPVCGMGEGITGAYPNSIWALGMLESAQMPLSVDHVPIHSSQNQRVI